MSEGRQIDATMGNKAAVKAAAAILFFSAAIVGLLQMEAARSYLWLKALHVVAIIAWMAGLVYLPRLFVYHTDAPRGSIQCETFKAMERRLLKVIMTPAMMISWLLGLWLAWTGNFFVETWFIVKFIGVVGLTGVHFFFAKSVKDFSLDRNEKTARQWRMYNEIPTVLMILIVVMVIVKPF